MATKRKVTKKAVAKKNGQLPAELAKEFEASSGLGFEEVTTKDLQMPFVRIAQAMSPQVKKNDAAFISGCGQGDIYNTVTNQFWGGDDGVVVQPVFFQMKFLEFVPRTEGGGFVGELASNSKDVLEAVRDKATGMELLSSGNELVRTAQHYVKIVHEDGNLESAVIDMKKTQLKKSRLWNSMMMMQKHNGNMLPAFANTYRLKSVEDGNDKGSWFTWSISLENKVESLENFREAKEFYTSIARGELQIAAPPPERVIESSSEEIPF
tara:strand:+ start:27 stop:824 length:798 start_codon:yes stop_codon:yes gene_type:complete